MKNIIKQFTDELRKEEKMLSTLIQERDTFNEGLAKDILQMHIERMLQKINASNRTINAINCSPNWNIN